MASPYNVRWGIMATGGIARTFVKDLLTNPAIRDVSDVRHTVAAVASSSSKARADEFLTQVDAPAGARTYGSYAELVADADVDIIYVATPHSHHFQNAMLALTAGKNVLCEKALTVTASQARKLVAEAEKRGLFFMEAVWTRYFPLSVKVRELVSSGAIGEVVRVIADNSVNFHAEDGKLGFDNSHRMVNRDLAGGALLDLGIYALTWVYQILYRLQPEADADKESPVVVSALSHYSVTGADENTAVVAHFPKHKTMGVATTGMRSKTGVDLSNAGSPAITIQGTGGEIQVMGPAYKPKQYRVVPRNQDGRVEVVDCPIPTDPARGDWGHGMFWEADEVARCLRDGRKESATLPWTESIAIMECMDKAIRDGGIEYPELITTDVFDPQSPLNTGKA